MDRRPSVTLALARGWYGFVGALFLLLTGGHVWGAIQGSAFDPPIVAGGLAVGVLAILAAAWVLSPTRLRAAVAWAGILALVAPFAMLFWIAAATASADAVALAAVPSVLAVAAAARMMVARTRATPGPAAEGA